MSQSMTGGVIDTDPLAAPPMLRPA